MEEWNYLTFPGVFKKNSIPAVYMHIDGEMRMEKWRRNEIKNTIEANSKTNMLKPFCYKSFVVLELNM